MGIGAAELETGSIVCAQSEGCNVPFWAPGSIELYVVVNWGKL